MAEIVLTVSTLLAGLAVVESFRLVRRTERGFPWILLSLVLVLMTARGVVTFLGLAGQGPQLGEELLELCISAAMLGGVRGLGRALEDLQQSQTARRLTEESYRALVANLPMVASVIDPNGTVAVLNPQFATVLT